MTKQVLHKIVEKEIYFILNCPVLFSAGLHFSWDLGSSETLQEIPLILISAIRHGCLGLLISD